MIVKLPAFVIFIFTLLSAASTQADASDRLMRRALRYFEPLPAQMPGAEQDTPARVALGRKLFTDKRLSINSTQSCSSCHRPAEKTYGSRDGIEQETSSGRNPMVGPVMSGETASSL